MRKHLLKTTLIGAMAVWAGLILSSGHLWAGWQEDVGYSLLVTELDTVTPDGSSVPVAQVEAAVTVDDEDTWIPDGNDDEFEGKTIDNISGAPENVFSAHATSVAGLFYGNTKSMAGGVDDIQAFYAGHWIGSGFLMTDMVYQPLISGRRVANHSWVGDCTDQPEMNAEILRRLDWVVDRDEYVQTVGLTNSSDSSKPLLASAFNVMAVGRTDASHSRETSAVDTIYTAERPCPALVAPQTTTSAATPLVGAAAALLIQVGRDNPGLSTDPVQTMTTRRDGQTLYNAERAEVIRAVLAAGADRFTRNSTNANIQDYRLDEANHTNNGLDIRYGAGQLNIHTSYHILMAGEQNSAEDGGDGVESSGFDYDPYFGGLDCNKTATYYLTADATHNLLTVALVWNIAIDGGSPYAFDGTATLYNLDMELADLTTGETVAAATDDGNNSEHMWLALEPGHDYALTVQRAADTSAFCWDYAIAWTLCQDSDLDLVPDEFDNCVGTANREQTDTDEDGYGNMCDCDIDGDAGGDGAVNMADYAVFRAAYGSTGSGDASENWNADADFNGDLQVNMADYAIFRSRWLQTAPFN